MRLVYRFETRKYNEELLRLCRISKDLYNQALYTAIKTLENDGKYLGYNGLYNELKDKQNAEGQVNYRMLKAQVAQQTLKAVDASVRSYFRAIKGWKTDKSKYKGMPRLPKYLPKDGFFLLTYTNQCCTIRDGRLWFSKTMSVKIPQWDEYKGKFGNFQQVRVLPRDGRTVIEIVYVDKNAVNGSLDYDRYASIDLGVDNLAALVTDFSEPLLYSGKQIKSKNRIFNKVAARLKSEASRCNGKKSTKRIRRLYAKRRSIIDDLMHKVSRHVVNTLNTNNVGNVVCGRNKGWKDSIRLGGINNQAFVHIPHERLISMLRYKCEMCGIRFTEVEESYTSKCDALSFEKICKHDAYVGKRVKRGLFQSAVGRLINADVNGALNIMRKVVGDSPFVAGIADSGRLFRPRKLNDLYRLGS